MSRARGGLDRRDGKDTRSRVRQRPWTRAKPADSGVCTPVKKGAGDADVDRSRVKVVVRIRPQIDEDIRSVSKYGLEFTNCIETATSSRVAISKPFYEPRSFQFDAVLPPRSSQQDTYLATAKPVVNDVIKGFNGTVMCYGQTGTGKTFTVFGGESFWHQEPDEAAEDILESECGIMPRAVRDLFAGAEASRAAGATVTVTMSFLQIYIERITDLLAPPSDVPTTRNFTLPIREDPTYGVFVDGLTAVRVESVADVLRMVRVGAANRATSSTHQNTASSRSHAMLLFTLEQTQPADEAASPTHNATTAELRRSTLRIVDLAGSERVSKSGSDGVRLEEAKRINKSIAALGNCVAALARSKAGGPGKKRGKKQHVPFRDSKLTRLLTDSLGGNTKTCLCANIGPSLEHYDETFTSLLFASRAMSVHTHAVINKRRYKVDRTPQSVASSGTLLTPVSVMSRASAAASANAGRKRRAKRRAARRVQLTPDSEHSPLPSAELKKANQRLEQENELLRDLLLQRQRTFGAPPASDPSPTAVVAVSEAPAVVAAPPSVGADTMVSRARSTVEEQLNDFYAAVDAPAPLLSAAARKPLIGATAAGFSAAPVAAVTAPALPTRIGQAFTFGGPSAAAGRPGVTRAPSVAGSTCNALALLATSSRAPALYSHALSPGAPLAPRAAATARPAHRLIGAAACPTVPPPAPASVAASVGSGVSAGSSGAAAGATDPGFTYGRALPAAAVTGAVHGAAPPSVPTRARRSGGSCWESRESHLVGKFTSIISGLQDEIKRQAEYIEGLQTSDAPPPTAGAAVPVAAAAVVPAAPMEATAPPPAPVPSAASMLSKLSGGLMAIPGFKQHLRVLLDNNKRRADAAAGVPGAACSNECARPLPEPAATRGALSSLSTQPAPLAGAKLKQRAALQLKPQVPAQRFDFVSPGRWDKENVRAPQR